ncbi:YdeI/OmpD-associated family protein [Microbacterium trichothecenolyticum]|uniref:YdeI/OmpD-associated family protein n=1 Tax=Microbacterium trichothecenolyticum TaxID=69370 RepID=UPI001C6E430E|nr:YdeI/OmpD-associated family protein [Microbacterium trichothecenolyticum]MBW9119984.1 YdeI/OmpD-associated family protein [Microbacterium trichothecenolyticum]
MGALDDGEMVEVTDAAAWRSWLEENHRTSKGAWLVRARPGSGLEVIGYEDAILQALCFGWIDGPVRSFDDERGGLWFAPRRATSGWAATNKARLIQLEEAGLMTEAGYRAVEVAKANGAWTVLDNAEALREPDDLAAALDAVPAARTAWDAFPPSSRKLGISNVDMARRADTRAARIAKIVADAAEGKRP